MRKNIFGLLALLAIIIFSCQKEMSLEQPGTPAEGSLQADVSGDCLPKTVNGVYSVGTALVSTTNTITVDVNVTRTGTYTITTDTVNGYYFRGVGIFTATGNNTVTLRGNGTPFANGINNFVVSFDGTVCDVQVTVASPAVFTLVGAPTCTAPAIAGTYGLNIPLTTANTVTLNVNVTTVGAYTITTTFQGMTFAKTGLFTATGAQTVVLDGTGTPTTAGANVVPITVGASTCSFTINVAAAGVGTLGVTAGACTPATVNGVYTSGVVLDPATNTVNIEVNVATAGTFSITTNTVAGFSFAFNGILNTTGVQTVILQGTGTPSGSGAQTFTVTLGANTCTFSVPLAGPGVGTLGGAGSTCAPITVNGDYLTGVALTATNTVTVQVNVTVAGSFNITTGTVNNYSFSFNGNLALGTQTVTLAGTGTPATAGANLFTVTINGATPSTCTFTCTPTSAEYFLRTAGSNWSYEFDNDPNDSLYRNVIAPTLTALGNTYTIFMQNDGVTPPPDSSGYYRKSGGDYFEWFDAGGFVGFDNPAWAEYIMVKDNVPVATNWKTPVAGFSGTVGGTPFKLRFSITLEQQNVPISFTTSLGLMNFTNVLVVDERIEAEVTPGVWQDITSVIDYYGKSYFARGIGLIKFEAFDASNVSQFVQQLRRYQVF